MRKIGVCVYIDESRTLTRLLIAYITPISRLFFTYTTPLLRLYRMHT